MRAETELGNLLDRIDDKNRRLRASRHLTGRKTDSWSEVRREVELWAATASLLLAHLDDADFYRAGTNWRACVKTWYELQRLMEREGASKWASDAAPERHLQEAQ